MTKAKGYKRRTYFIDKKFQTKFILKFCALVAVGGFLTIGILYCLAVQSTTVSFVDSRVVVQTTADFILPILLQTVLIVMIVVSFATIFITLFVSHKIAGPLFRFKKVLKVLAEGDFSRDVKIRRLDQLQDVAEVFNVMIAKVRKELQELKHNFQSLKEKLNHISEKEISKDKRACLSELKRISAELNRIIHYFKT